MTKILSGLKRRRRTTDSIFYKDESWFTTTGDKFNPQNERTCGEPPTNKDLATGNVPRAPQKQRGKGVMARVTAPAFRDGTVLVAHFAPDAFRLNGDCYKNNLLSTDIIPEIRREITKAPNSRWTWARG